MHSGTFVDLIHSGTFVDLIHSGIFVFAMYLPELGTRQHCRTMLSGQKPVDYGVMSIFAVAIPFRTEAFPILAFFLSLKLQNVTVSCCRCREAKELSRAQLCYVLPMVGMSG